MSTTLHAFCYVHSNKFFFTVFSILRIGSIKLLNMNVRDYYDSFPLKKKNYVFGNHTLIDSQWCKSGGGQGGSTCLP